MAEHTYEYECMRAELLGVEAPNREDFERRRAEELAELEEVKEITKKNIETVVETGIDLQPTAGKLDELNSILSATQKKIDRFKFRCGSVAELIKTKITGIGGENGGGSSPPNSEEQTLEPQEEHGDAEASAMKSDLTKALDKQTDALDSLLDKAESASINMSEQNKQMKRLLR